MVGHLPQGWVAYFQEVVTEPFVEERLMEPLEPLMNANELKKYLRISRLTLARLLDAGLPHIGWGHSRIS